MGANQELENPEGSVRVVRKLSQNDKLVSSVRNFSLVRPPVQRGHMNKTGVKAGQVSCSINTVKVILVTANVITHNCLFNQSFNYITFRFKPLLQQHQSSLSLMDRALWWCNVYHNQFYVHLPLIISSASYFWTVENLNLRHLRKAYATKIFQLFEINIIK